MVQGYYTLEESANILGMSPDELKQLAHKGEIRSFQDRGTWRFRIQDIQEMSRRRSGGSDLELALGESLKPMPTDSPAPRSPKPQKKDDDVFSLVDDDRRPDSDVKLGDSGPKSAGPRSSKTGMAGPKSSRSGKTKHSETPPVQADSGVRLVADSDSDVRIVGADSDDAQIPLGEPPIRSATDSDVRLEKHFAAPRGGEPEGHLTEEINLDEELQKDEARLQQQTPRGKPQVRQPEFPKKSPFDLSQSELDMAAVPEEPKAADKDSSSDFELTPASESSSPLELGTSDEFKLQPESDEEIVLGSESRSNLDAPRSGINLSHPADSGISLEQPERAASEDEFELTLDAESTPQPGKPSTPQPASGRLLAESDDSDSSEFELSLDADVAAVPDSDSEFELTLDDAGGLSPLEETAGDQGEEKDIFETDFDVPGLEEESGSEAVAVDEAETDLGSSDFDIGVEDDAVAVDESGSDVVAIDDDIAIDDDAPPARGKKRGKKKAYGDDEGGVAVMEEDEEIIVEEEEAAPQMVAVKQAPWGIFPVMMLVPCVIVMLLLGMMGVELVQAQQGYKQGMLTKAISGMIDGKK